MEDFTNPNLELVLGVKEGSHFDRVQKPTIIIATLNGRCLETKKVQPDSNPQFATDLTWETDKNSLRKMRCNQTPIKVECYAVNDNGSREKLGYILLSVRCAQIIHKSTESNIKTTWHNILGVRNDFNSCKPRLLLYLIIREKDVKTINSLSKNEELNLIDSIPSNITPVWQQEEQLLQLGPFETCHDIFLLHITAEIATNLNRLVQEFKDNGNNNFIFIYILFDILIKLKPFKLESDRISLNEKVTVKIRTSLPILAQYLNSKSHFFVRLKDNSVMISQSEVNLKPLVPTTSLQEFRELKNAACIMDYYCVLKNVYSKENKGDYRTGEEIDKLPSLKMLIKLQHLELKDACNEKYNSHFHYSPRLQQTKDEILSNRHSNLEQKISNSRLNKHLYRTSENSSLEKIVHFNESPQINNFKSPVNNFLHHKEENTKSTVTYRSYCLNIYLNAIKFLNSRPDVQRIEFRFYHPQGEIISAICCDLTIVAEQIVQLQDVKCQLHLISTSDGIEQLLTTFVPKINICDVTGTERKCIAQIYIDIKQLFLDEKPECQYQASLIDCHSKNEIGCTNITMILEDYTISMLNKIKQGIPEPALDDSLAYKIVDELETWKERQKEIFKDELRKKEEAHLTLLSEEWQRRRECLESKLSCSVQQCKILANNLNKTTENLRVRKIQSLQTETKLIQEKEELQWKYERKLHQLQDALQKMQEEFTTKLMNLEDQNRDLILQVESLNEKKYELEKIKMEQTEKLEAYKKGSLSEDQTTSVLQQLKNLEEKLDNAQKSKTFFKEQWSNAVKEIHRIKMENQRAIESQIKNSKEELDNLDLEEILHADSTALTHDQIALNQIQREIEIMNPDSTLPYYRTNTKEQLFAPQSDFCLNLDPNLIKSDISTSSSASDRRLHMLIEERDSLLKMGNYTSEDGIIIKLNAEIRSLLMNS